MLKKENKLSNNSYRVIDKIIKVSEFFKEAALLGLPILLASSFAICAQCSSPKENPLKDDMKNSKNVKINKNLHKNSIFTYIKL